MNWLEIMVEEKRRESGDAKLYLLCHKRAVKEFQKKVTAFCGDVEIVASDEMIYGEVRLVDRIE